MIGYEPCLFIPSGHSRAEILEHFGTSHDVIIQNGNATCIRLENIVGINDRNDDYWWTPILLNFESNDTGPLFLILGSTSGKDKLTSWMCLLLWSDKKEKVSNLYADFSLRSFNEVSLRAVNY